MKNSNLYCFLLIHRIYPRIRIVCRKHERIEQSDRRDLSFFNFARISTHISYRFRENNKPVLLSHRPRWSSQKYLSLRDKREYHGARPKRIMTPFLHLHSAFLFTELSSRDRGKCAIRNQKFPYLFPNKTLFRFNTGSAGIFAPAFP